MSVASKKAGYADAPRKFGYYAVKYLFKSMVSIFYSEVEVVGSDNFPVEGPVVVALNHVNSLTDAAIAISSCPRDVRLTCKDTLLTQKGLFPFLIRNIESIPIQRKMDYADNADIDNSRAFNTLYGELGNGCCVGLFPEGLCKYKPQLSQFRTGVARIAIDYVCNALSAATDAASTSDDNVYRYPYIHIVPVGITYLHREMFRSDVGVRIHAPIKIDADFFVQNGLDSSDMQHIQHKDVKYKLAKQVTSELYQTILSSTIASPNEKPNWHIICLSHLARQIAFPESSSPRMGVFLAQYVDLTQKFNRCFVENADNARVQQCEKQLDVYFRLLYKHGLKDNRIMELEQNTSNASIVARMAYRGVAALVLCALALPGFVLASPIVAAFRAIRFRKVKVGITNNYDEVAQTKMFAIFTLVPTLAIAYTYALSRHAALQPYSKWFALCFPFGLWMTMRLSQDGTAQLTSFWSLLKMLMLSSAAKKRLVQQRKECKSLVQNVTKEFDIKYDPNMIGVSDLERSRSIRTSNQSWSLSYMLRRLWYGRVKNDWNETMRLYDVPVDEFHLSGKHEEQLQKGYAFQ